MRLGCVEVVDRELEVDLLRDAAWPLGGLVVVDLLRRDQDPGALERDECFALEHDLELEEIPVEGRERAGIRAVE